MGILGFMSFLTLFFWIERVLSFQKTRYLKILNKREIRDRYYK